MLTPSRQFGPDRLIERKPRSRRIAHISTTLTLIALVIFLPDELSFYIFDFRLTLIRFILFLLTPILLIRLGISIASRQRRLLFPDFLVIVTGVWMIVSPTIVVDLAYSLHHSGPNVAEFCGAYLAGRLLLSEQGQAHRFLELVCHVIAIVALFGILDALTGGPATHDFVRALTGSTFFVQAEFRLGVFRSMGPIAHPILFGITCAIGLLLAIALPIRAKSVTIASCAFGVVVSVSSGPIEGTLLGLALLAFDSIFARFQSRWLLLIGIVATGYGTLSLVTASPLDFINSYLDIDPGSYWGRVYQWQTDGSVVLDHPWFGIAFQWPEIVRELPFWAMLSIDSLWLFLALVYGIPGAILVGLSIIGPACYPTSGRSVHLTAGEAKMARTLGIILIVIVLLGFTVDIWEATWIFVALLVGVRVHLIDLASRPASSPMKVDQRSSFLSVCPGTS